ncbi:MAG: cyclase family protein [Acetobacteraceae bacterium]|nr:cyclase family protein [Acetobacteraceae bacterium]
MNGMPRRHVFGAVCGGCLAVQQGMRATPVQAQGAGATAAAAGPVRPSRWGPNDTIGNMNLVTPQKSAEAARLVTQGRSYHMGVVVDRNTPAFPPRSIGVNVFMPGQEGGRTFGTNRMSYMDDLITGWLGVGTQLDTFAHLGTDYTFYNGNKAVDILRTTGVTKLGVDGVPPMVTRGVLVDLAKAKGKPRLDGGELVTADELRAAMQAQNVRVTPGDVVVLHTGWLSLIESDPRRFGAEEPGIDAAGAELLAGMQPCAVGADTWGVECVPFKDPNVIWQGHQVLLADNGIHILENLDTSGLVRDGVNEFMFVLGAPRYRGAVQAIINPIAIR